MNELPPLLRRSPTIFYIAAGALFAWYLGNTYFELSSMHYDAAGLQGFSSLVKSKALFEAVRESLYMAASGASLQIMIAIYDRVKRA